MLLIPEQVKFLRESIISLKAELDKYDTYLEDRGVTNIESSRRIQAIDYITNGQFLAKQNKLREYQNLLSTSEFVKEIPTEEIGIGTKFIIQFDEEDASEEFTLVESIIGSNLSSEAITMESALGKSILGKKEGESFSYMPRPNCVITGKIVAIKKKNSDYISFIRSIKKSHRMSAFASRKLAGLEDCKRMSEVNDAQEKRPNLSKSQLELLQEEVDRLSKLYFTDSMKRMVVTKRISEIKKLIETRKVAQLPTDDSIGVGSSFSIMFFGDDKVTWKRVEMIDQAVSDELADHYVERISTLGSQVYGLKNQEEFIIQPNGNRILTGIVYDIDNQQEKVQANSPLEYQKAKRG